MSQWKIVEGSGRNGIITTYLVYVDLKIDVWSFRIG